MKCLGMMAALMAAVGWFGGCQKTATPPAAAAITMPGIPTRAQPRLTTMKLWIGGRSMEAELALNELQRQTGMMFRTNMAENDGMLFVFPEPFQASFWMMNTSVPLSAAYINHEGVIEEIHDLKPHDTNSVTAQAFDIQYVLETPQGWFARNHIGAGTVVSTERGPLRDTFTTLQR